MDYDPATEELVPDPVDYDPGGEWMILCRELPGELQAPGTSVLQRSHGEKFGQVSTDAFPGRLRTASLEDVFIHPGASPPADRQP